MKRLHFFISYRPVFATLFLLLFFVMGARSQSKGGKVIDSVLNTDKSISISNISNESEKLNKRIHKLEVILKPSTEITELDSLLNWISSEVNKKKDSLIPELENMSARVLKVNKVEWNNYHDQLEKYQEILKDRSEEISGITDEITKEIDRWEQTKEQLEKNEASGDVYEALNKIIVTLKEVRQVAHARIDDVFVKQKRLTELVLTIDEVVSEIKLAELQQHKDFFVFDSKPLWKSSFTGLVEVDSTKTAEAAGSTTDQIITKLKENKDQLKDFFVLNGKTAILQVLFLLILFIVFFRLNIKWDRRAKKMSSPIEKQTKIILSHSVSSSIVVGLLISSLFYADLIPPFIEIMIVLILLGTIFLLPKITTKSFRLPLALILLSYLIQVLEAYLVSDSSPVRIFIIIDALVLITALVTGRIIMSRTPEKFKPVYRLFKLISPIYIFFIVVAMIANIIGMVSFSLFLIFGILNSTALGMVIFLAVKIVTSIVVLFFGLRDSFSIQALSTMVHVTNKRIKPLLNLVGLLVWLMFTLKGFALYDLLVNQVNELMAIHWEVGEMTISLGGILSFLGIFIVSLLLAKLAAAIFQDEWMVNVLPRGVAPAVSLLLRILLISIGLYMALSAAGLDVSKLGFMVGALGVGIGFGLQNVVLNFVAGLILAFERPINLGDTIEVDQELGVVTNIGVRSSNIKSYSGYEAIIPNGDLISKKVINYTLTDRNRRSKIIMKTTPDADPEKVITLLTEMAKEHPKTLNNPKPITYFYGYDDDGNLTFTLFYWTTFSDTLVTDSEISLNIFAKLKEEGIQAPVPARRIIKEH